MSSISQNVQPDALPDLRNLGVIARVLLGAHLLALGAAIFAEPSWPQALMRFARVAALLEPLLLLSVVALYLASPWLARLPYAQGCALLIAIELALAAAVHAIAVRAGSEFAPGSLLRLLALTAGITLLLLGYFRLWARAYSPALAEARLQALQARIRPHFLFNSLNAVLSLIRRDPRRAERALEDLADLFRELMADGRRFVRLADEIALLERYAGIEKLRLGERLRIVWELDGAPSDALLPPMVLQPLLENAVYHGVEPATGASDVLVRIERRGNRVLARIENPYREHEMGHRAGNRMALDNIRERLRLFFDAEARLESAVEAGRYRVEIEMPYRSGGRGRP
ncbi:MAG: sensor histidine kinase [Betaproteobacteria bacterium]|nr:MAG: sensor histidine kinase [Betaproteobacteria bacterium]